MVLLKRVYEPPSPEDGFRVLVERLWPRGLSKERARVDLWMKEISPSPELRKWFGHDPDKWVEFQARYRAELEKNPDVAQMQQILRDHPVVTFVYAAHDEERNSAVLLKQFLDGS